MDLLAVDLDVSLRLADDPARADAVRVLHRRLPAFAAEARDAGNLAEQFLAALADHAEDGVPALGDEPQLRGADLDAVFGPQVDLAVDAKTAFTWFEAK